MPLTVPVVQTGLEASIQAAAIKAGRNLKLDMGVSAKSIGALSQPLGKITGQADQFTQSMAAANARVLAFGASVGVIAAIGQGFKDLILTTIAVEKSLADINSVLGANSSQLNKFKNDIFSIAKETGNSFDTVSEAALELSRQGIPAAEALRRLKDSMILSRLSGLDAASAVEGLTAAVNSFSKEGITTSEVLNKISKTAAGFAVSERDLIEGFKRSASVAQQAGVSLDELGGIITAVQQKTARGGAVIGNAFKTIFTRIQSGESLEALTNIGVAVTDMQGKLLPTTKLLEGLAVKMKGLNDIKQAEITEKIGGGFQIGPLIAALDDITSKTSVFKGATEAMATAGSEAYQRNIALNKTLDATINATTVSLKELANTLGEIGVTDNLKNILSFFGSFLDNIKDVLQGEGLGADFAKGLIKGISAVISGPGLLIFGAIIAKLTYNFVQFGAQALRTFFNIGSAAKEIGAIQSSIAYSLLTNKEIQTQILALEGNRVAQAQFFSTALNTQLQTMEKMRAIAKSISPDVYRSTTGSAGGKRGKAEGYIPRSAEGYMPTVMEEANDIRKGVGGARPSDKPVVVPNFNFGGGKIGTMVANTGEHIIKNYGGSTGSAVFNRNMSRGGLPAGAEQIRGAGGFIPNFAKSPTTVDEWYAYHKVANPRIFDKTRPLGTEGGKVFDRITGKSATQAEREALIKIKNERSKSSGSNVLTLDASQLGFVSVFGATSDSANATDGDLTPDERKKLKTKDKGDYDTLVLQGIKTRSLKSFQEKTNESAQKQFRSKANEYLLTPILNLAGDILPGVFGTEKVGARAEKILKGKGKGDPYVFSDSVLGGIFEAAVALSTSKATEIRAFDSTEKNTPFDFEAAGGASQAFKKAFGFVSEDNIFKAEAKKTQTTKTLKETVGKALRDEAVLKALPVIKSGASGYVPNFADPLKDAILRESAAGVDPSKIYVDQNNSLKGSMNPFGLMVANTRDEPSGGWQGIDRARKEGSDAKAYGSANGFVPNYAKKLSATDFSNPGSLGLVGDNGKSNLKELNNKINELGKSVKKNEKTLDAATKELEDFIKTLKKASGANISASTAKRISGVASDQLAARSNQKSPDLLGTIFAVQAGLTLLSGATEGATNTFAKFTSALTGGLANVAAAGFAYQGFSQIANNAEGKMGKFLGKAGAYGAIAAGAFSAIGAIGDSYDALIGVTDKATIGMEKIAKAAEQAAFQLSDYSKGEQGQITKRSSNLVENATFIDTSTGGSRINFEGFEKFGFGTGELQKQLEASVSQALAAGVDYKKIWKSINDETIKGKTFTAELIDSLSSSFAKMAKEGKTATIELEKFLKVDADPKVASALKNLEDYDFEKRLKGDAFNSLRKKIGGDKEFQDKAIRTVRDNVRGSAGQQESLLSNLRISNEKALLDVLKKKLEISLEIRDIILNSPSSAQRALSIEKELNTTLESRKILIENQIEGNKRVVDLVSQQSKVVASKLTEKSLEGQILGSLDATQKVDKEEYAKVAGIVNNTLDSLQKQGGWNKIIEKDLNDQLKTLQTINGAEALQVDARSKIVNSVSVEAYGLKEIANVKNQIVDLEQQSLAIARATNFIDEQKKKNSIAILSNRNSELEGISRIEKAKQETRKLRLERSVIGGSDYAKAGAQAEVLKQERTSVLEESVRNSEKIINNLQKSLLERANNAKVNAGPFTEAFKALKDQALEDKRITDEEKAKLIDAANKFSEKIEKAGIQEAKNALEASFSSKEAIINASISTALAGEVFKSTIVSAAEEFSKIIKEIDPSKTASFGSKIKSAISGFFTPSSVLDKPTGDISEGTLADLQKQRAKLSLEKQSALSGFEGLTPIDPSVAIAGNDLKAASLEAENALMTISNSLLQLGVDASTFANSVSNVFRNLRQEAAQNEFSLLGATSPDALISGGLERIKNTALQTGPQTPETVKQTANDVALLSKKLDYETAIDASTKSRLKFEYEQTVKILQLKEELLKATSSEETEAILRKIKETAALTEGLSSRMFSLFNPTDQERKKDWENSFVSASEKFRDNVIDGITSAVEQGGSLGDILRSAGLDFAREMTRANLKNLFGLGSQAATSSGGAIAGIFGALVGRATGGPITGGSGSKDDVPAMLMGGEYVMNKKAVQKYGSGFMEAINNGSMSGYAKGGSVIRERGFGSNVVGNKAPKQSGGDFYIPGYYGSSAISGKKNLLQYARQGYTSGEKDIISSGDGFSSIDLSPESVRLTNFGRRQGPMADAVRESKKEAFGLYLQQIAADKAAKDQEKADKKAFKKAIKMALITAVAGAAINYGAGVVKTGYQQGVAETGTFMGGVKGIGTNVGKVGSGLGSLFTGDFKSAGAYFNGASTLRAIPVGSGLGSSADSYGSGISNNQGYVPPAFPTGLDGHSSDVLLKGSNSFSTPKIEIDGVGDSSLWEARATGGQIPYKSGIDTVPAMLSGGEFIMNAAATQRIGAGNLNSLNSGAATEKSSSESDPKLIAKLDELIKITKESGKAVTVNVSSPESKSEESESSAGGEKQQDQNLSRKIKAAVVQVLQEEKRLGGVLRRA